MNRLEKRLFHRGFTLTELVATIVIITILAAVAIPNMSSFTDEAKISRASATFASLKASYAVQLAIKKGGAVPAVDIVAGHDPICTGGASLTQTCGNAVVVLSGAATAVTAPASWTCTVSDVAGQVCQ